MAYEQQTQDLSSAAPKCCHAENEVWLAIRYVRVSPFLRRTVTKQMLQRVLNMRQKRQYRPQLQQLMQQQLQKASIRQNWTQNGQH